LLEQLIERGWVSADAETLLGKCLESQHQAVLANAAYAKAFELDPLNIARYDDLISLELESGKISDAEALAKRAVRVAPRNARAWVLKGNAELRGNAYQEALQSYLQAAKLDPSDPDTMLLIGGVHFLTGDYHAAITDYQTGIDRFPNDSRFYVNCAEVLLGSPDVAELQSHAQSLLERAIKLAPHSAEAHYQLGQLALRQGQLQNAEGEFLASLESEPNRSKTHYALSLVYRRIGRLDDSDKQFAIYQQLKGTEESVSGAAVKGAAIDVELVKP
jgi:tetratricopeptide (TPR) repeat protein